MYQLCLFPPKHRPNSANSENSRLLNGGSSLRRRKQTNHRSSSEHVETGQRAVVEDGWQLGELGALGRSEQFVGGHGGLAYVARLPQKTAYFLRQRYAWPILSNDHEQE